MSESLTHSRGCPCSYGEPEDPCCTCGLKYRIMLQTEQEMHAAWRKRAEEAEAELQMLRDQKSDEAFHVLARELAQNSGKLGKGKRLPPELMKALNAAIREVNRSDSPSA